MKCSFCDTEIKNKPISVHREVHTVNSDDFTQEFIFKQDNNFCSRICAIAEDIMFRISLQIITNENIKNLDDDDSYSEEFDIMADEVLDDVVEDCDCTEEEFSDAMNMIYNVMGNCVPITDESLSKYL